MKLAFSSLFALAAAGIAAAAPTAPVRASTPSNELDSVSNANCTRQTYTVTSSNAMRTQFNVEAMGNPAGNQTQTTQLFLEFITDQSGFMSRYVTGTQAQTQDFNISGVFCEPTGQRNENAAVQLLLHGIGFDGSYWNFQGQNVSEEQYSYVYNAAARGISTFRYDRIGTGSSEAPSDVFNVAQAATEVGILEAVAEKLKNSTEIGGRAWNRTLLVGHSYGSAQSQALSVARPELVDGIILQGFSANATGLPFYLAATVYTEASQVFPRALARLPPGWLVTATPASNQLPFVWAPTADASAVALARNTEQAVTQGSLFSIGSIGGPSNFTGPVAVVLGDKDFIFALNDIQGPNGTNKAQAAASMLYAQSSNATGIVLPDVGHAVNIHRGAQQAYTQMLDFAAVNGLA